MLGKLIKYEFKATGRMILPLYAAIIAVTLINKMMFSFNAQNFAFGIPQTVSMMIYVLLIGAMFVITLLVMIQRFYKNLMKDEGYLMFTLPVDSVSHISSKLIVSFVWIILSIVVSLLSVFILAYEPGIFNAIAQFFGVFFERTKALGIGPDITVIIIEGILYLTIALMSSILMIYCSISIGQLFNQHKVAGSFVAYMGIYMLMQIVNSIILVSVVSVFHDIQLVTTSEVMNFIKIAILGLLLLDTLWASAFFFTSKYLLKNKLNLE